MSAQPANGETVLGRAASAAYRVMGQRAVFVAFLVIYAGSVVLILGPVISGSVGADDSYWILQVAEQTHGSYWAAIIDPLSHAFDFDGQARTTALATAERRLLALATIRLAVQFAIPPAVIWGLVKLGLIVALLLAVWLFLREFRYRDRSGTVTGFSSTTIAFIVMALPLAVAAGVKAQTVGSINGWLFYPSLTYGPIVVYLLVGALLMRLTRVLEVRFGRWVVPVVLLMAALGFGINLAYEFIALAVPVAVLVVLVQPNPERSGIWMRWRAKLAIILSFAGVYAAVFLWIRWRLNQMPCHAEGDCYTGTIVEVNATTLVNNVLGALPGGTGEFVVEQVRDAGRTIVSPSLGSVTLAIVALVAFAGVWISWRRRQALTGREVDSAPERGLLTVAVVCLIIGLGGAVITGITARAVELVDSPLLPYRNGVLTWSAFVIAGLAVLRFLLSLRLKTVGYLTVGLAAAAILFSVSNYFPRNVVSAQINRAHVGVQFIDTLHYEVALGDRSRNGDARRCEAIEAFMQGRSKFSETFSKSMEGAYSSFQFFHHKPYCSTGVGLGTRK